MNSRIWLCSKDDSAIGLNNSIIIRLQYMAIHVSRHCYFTFNNNNLFTGVTILKVNSLTNVT